MGARVRGILGRPWGEIPLPLRISVALSLATLPVGPIVASPGLGLFLFSVAFVIVLALLLLRGSRVVWTLLVFADSWPLLTVVWIGGWWLAWIPVSAVHLVLLFWPSSRRFVWQKLSSEDGVALMGTSWDVDARPESDRPDGWYVDADNPRRMRYWRSETGEWLGSAKVPRKLKNHLPAQPAQPDSGPAQAQTTWEPSTQQDADRPRGWYVDPGDPARMRYWAGEDSGWQGRVKTPGKIRQEWEGRG